MCLRRVDLPPGLGRELVLKSCGPGSIVMTRCCFESIDILSKAPDMEEIKRHCGGSPCDRSGSELVLQAVRLPPHLNAPA